LDCKQLLTALALVASAAASASAQSQPTPLPPVDPPRQTNELRILTPPRIAEPQRLAAAAAESRNGNSPSVVHAQATSPIPTPNTNPESIPPGNPAVPGPVPTPPGTPENFLSKPFTVEELESIALGNNPALARASAAVRAANGKWVQAGLPPNPNIGYSAAEVGNDGRAGQQGGYIEQEFVRGHKLQLSRNVVSQEIRQAEQQLAAEQFRVVNDVRIGFYEVLVLERKMELAGRLLEIGRKSLKTSEQLFEKEQVSRLPVQMAQNEFYQTQMVALNAKNSYRAAWQRLAAVLGTPGIDPVPLAGNLEAVGPEITWADAFGRLMAASPELAAASAAVTRAHWSVDRARAERVPNINVQATAQHDNATTNDIAGVQATFPLPLINRNQGGIMQAQAEVAQACAQLQQLRLSLQQRLAATYERYANARQQVEIYSKNILPNAKASFDLVTQVYQHGETDYLNVLTAQRTYFQANLAYLDALRELRETTIELEGLLLRDSLQSQISMPRDAGPAPQDINQLITPMPY
jgi:outer membrane protein, heavy metal efflux system